MDKPLGQHIAELEKRMRKLSHEIMQNRKTREERNVLESELRVTQQALAHYQQAMQVGKTVANPVA